MRYKKVTIATGEECAVVLRVDDNTYIPCDPANTDYQHYLTWLGEGNEPDPSEPPNA